ncbi:hypothetical protein V3477_31275, partial [Pseudomonas aeruginosa]
KDDSGPCYRKNPPVEPKRGVRPLPQQQEFLTIHAVQGLPDFIHQDQTGTRMDEGTKPDPIDAISERNDLIHIGDFEIDEASELLDFRG